ncbi:MAG TPA: TIGR04282 family arsenosugar biosynthesis glycosyltransferase [Pseudonocardiaceae bacterium]|nr:TIGR04282 family arsenosugar biosynthesis glycosyltransferase [Pseudonocardiaceae bacterium]
MNHTGPSVLIMAKAPRPGTVKTRLTPLLGPAGCARLQAALLAHAATLAHEAAPGSTYLAFDPPDAVGEIRGLVSAEVRSFPQVAGHLGVRLAAATETVLARGPGPLLVIGTDAPTLTPAILNRAVTALRGHDVVFGPALDGGYYLVGLRRPCLEVFGIDSTLWSGPRVLAASRAAAERAGLTVGLLPALRDLDTPADATALRTDPHLPPALAALLSPAAV